jgi:hypothetical protein
MALNRKLQNQKYFLNGFSSGFLLLNQFCYTHRPYFNSFGKSVFYPNHIFWARVAGRLIWACFSSKIPNAAPYPREVNHETYTPAFFIPESSLLLSAQCTENPAGCMDGDSISGTRHDSVKQSMLQSLMSLWKEILAPSL